VGVGERGDNVSVSERLEVVRARIADAAAHAGRNSDEIHLVGISKGVGSEVIAEAINAGLQEVGENRVQEAAAKRPGIEAGTRERPRWHLVGHLQSNKARAALGLFDTIQSADSPRIAQTLSRVAERPVRIFLEVQFQHSPDRFGFEPDGVGDALREIALLPNVDVVGLMTVAPLGLDQDGTRRVFRHLREIRDRLQEDRRDQPQLELSMGMTDDFPIAIEEGATVVRIGRAIFAP
jgi:pyridoxal phosphate enzyme (YggS family)